MLEVILQKKLQIFVRLVRSTKKFIRFQNYIEESLILVCGFNCCVLVYDFFHCLTYLKVF